MDHDALAEIKRLVGKSVAAEVVQYEKAFAAMIGSGSAVSFAAGRMAFYALMKALRIGVGDEVILLGATCSVMANAILRLGARPVYADIDPETYGSSADGIAKVITSATKMIVAQHSFGIPCKIEPIVALARARGIFLMEDCALTLSSKIDGQVVGTFGDAALFSTDHSKPLNTLIGGMVYSRDQKLIASIRSIQQQCGELPVKKQRLLYQRLLIERKYCNPKKYGRMALIDPIVRLLNGKMSPFLDEDFGIGGGDGYPYPAKLPAFIARLGMLEIARWPKIVEQRKQVLSGMLSALEESGGVVPIPYRDNRLDIVPLRLAWHAENGEAIRRSMPGFLDVSWIWFMTPIVAAKESLDTLGYRLGSCPVAESIGAKMINLPCNLSGGGWHYLANLFRGVHTDLCSSPTHDFREMVA